jgi:hypothetical protein
MHRFPIGTQYTGRNGKVTRVCTVSEQLTVTDSTGAIVKEYYHSTHEFLGGRITDYDVCETTIARNLIIK